MTIVASLLPASGLAQSGRATLTGRVIDQTGAPIGGARAEAVLEQSPETPVRSSAGVDGVYELSGLSAGIYNLTVSGLGFKTLKIKSVAIADGQDKHLRVLELTVASSGCSGSPIDIDYIQLLENEDRKGDLVGAVRRDLGPMVGESPPVAGATVDLFCGTKTRCRSVKTGERGEFLFRSLTPGRFAIRISSPGFYPSRYLDFEVKSGLQLIYNPVYIERCRRGNCDPKLRPKKAPAICE